SKAGNVRSRRVTPYLEMVPPHFVPAPSGPHQNEEVAEEDEAGPHSHEHLTQVHEDGCQEEGVGHQVLKLEAEVFQQQQERRNRQPHAGGDVRGEQHKLPCAEVAKRNRACSDPPAGLLCTPPEQPAHRVQLFLGLEAAGMNKGCHLSVEVRSSLRGGARGKEGSKAKGRKGWKEEGECGKVTAVYGSLHYKS